MTSRRLCAATVAALVLLAGCSSSEQSDTSATTDPTPQAETNDTASPAESPNETTNPDNGATEAGVDPANATPIATATVGAGSDEESNTSLTVGLLGVERRGNLLYLTGSLHLNADSGSARRISVAELSGMGFDPTVIDPVGLMEYGVVNTDDGPVRTDRLATWVYPGQTTYIYAVLAAPPADVTTVDVNLWPGAPTFTGVQIR